MKNYKEIFKGKKVTCMGLGLLGGMLNDAKFLLECGAELTITDLKSEKELASSIKKLSKFNSTSHKLRGTGNIKYVLGRHDLADFKIADFILQPGNVPMDSPYLLEAKKNNIPVYVSESLFMEYADGVITVGVTGTRGKTTTTCLIYEILKSKFGRKVHLDLNSSKGTVGRKTFVPKVFLGGNIKGTSTLALLKTVKPEDVVVMELDSWCLHGLGDIRKSPNVAVFTNLLPDHLNFYLKGSRDEAEAMQKYFMDKAQIFVNQKAEDYLILDKEIKKIIDERYKGEIKSRIVLIKPSTSYVDGLRNWKLKVKGEHNLQHIRRAVEVGKIFGLDMKSIKTVVENFRGVEGRQEFLREYKGIKIYNDTTATTPDATIAALKALGDNPTSLGASRGKKLVLISGGADKGLDMSGLMKEIPKYCKSAVLLSGSGTEKLKKNFGKQTEKMPVFDNLKSAVKQALALCKRGDTLILSPGFASFGMFKNEYDRGEQFNKIIKSLK